MAEVILSPGVFQIESDQSIYTQAPAALGAAIVGPTVAGRPFVPTYVTTYTQYLSLFGDIFKSGSYYYEYFTSQTAREYFQNGGQSLLVTRIISGSNGIDTYATSNVAAIDTLTNGTAATVSLNLTNAATAQHSASINGLYTLSLSGSTPQEVYNRLTGSAAYSAISSSVVSASSFTNPNVVFTAIPKGTTGNIYYITSGSTTTLFTGGADIQSFQLETLAWGNQMNDAATPAAVVSGSVVNGALPSGSSQNIRWEVTNINTGSNGGTFTIVVRRGDDNNSQKNILETWANVSLDPQLPNYISRVIGDLKPVYNVNTGQIDFQGTYPNQSLYVRVSSVTTPNVDSIDNNGNFKTGSYATTLPFVGSGSAHGGFTGGVADTTATKLMNETITINNIQGFHPDDYNRAFTLLSNKDEYRFNVLLAPGIGLDTTAADNMISTCEGRGDAIAIVDNGIYTNATVAGAVQKAAGQSSNYAATYFPWVQLFSNNLGKTIWCPPSTVIGGVLAFNDQSSAEWFAPAGLNRGGIPSVVRAQLRLSQTDRDTLYTGNVNPLATFPGTGVCVWGQKTLQRKPTSLDRVNVRRLLIALKDFIGGVARNLVFEQNTAVTRNRFLNQVNPYLDTVVQRQGLFAYKVVMDDTNNTPDVIDRNQLVGQIYIQPTKTAEFIILNFNLTPTGATFPV
jgi:phage tail sheath protein FI